MGQKVIVCRIERCLGCRSCEIACTLAHAASDNLYDAVLEEPRPEKRVRVEGTAEFGLPLQCRHCEDAPCLMVCPTHAIQRAGESDPVLIDTTRCIGCRMCVAVCPFGVIEMSRNGRAAVKCDLCIERTKAGKEPACVAACPTKAMRFVDLKEYTKEKRQAAAAQMQAEAKR